MRRKSPANAARLYLQIARQTGRPEEAAEALVANARCLNNAGRPAEAIEILTGEMMDHRYRSVTDEQSRHILPNALLLALNLMKDPAHPRFRKTAASLAEVLNNYEGAPMPSGQRRFLMKQLQSLWPFCPPFPTQQAEELAVAYLSAHPQEIKPGQLVPAALPGVWVQRTADRAALVLFKQENLGAQLSGAVAASSSIRGVQVFVAPPGSSEPHLPAISPAGALSTWQVHLRVESPDPFASAALQKRTLYLWAGVLTSASIALLAFLMAGYLRLSMDCPSEVCTCLVTRS